MNKPRFKIDVYDSSFNPVALYFRVPGFFRDRWMKIDSFATQELAKARYEVLKDLPEYLP